MTDSFVSGTSGLVTGRRATVTSVLADAAIDAIALGQGQPWRLRRAAADGPRRRVLAVATERRGQPNLLPSIRAELLRSRHAVQFASTEAGDRGRFENLNLLLKANQPYDHDWLLVIDDDVSLPAAFLDVFVFLSERFALSLAQPAHRRRSHAAWALTRRRPASVVRETRFVEIGPVLGLHQDTFAELLPFPELRAGWGVDAHWAALARQHGWRQGVIDATPIRHLQRPIGASYDRDEALAEARAFLSGRDYEPAWESQRTLVTHRSWK